MLGWDAGDYSRLRPGRKPARARRRWRAAFAALALLAGAASAAAGDAVPLTDAADIAEALRDRTFSGAFLADGEPWTEYYAPDGRSAYAVRGCVFRGRWWAADGRACFAYPELEAGTTSCFAMARRDAATIDFSVDGADGKPVLVTRTRTIEAGNAGQLPLDAGACVGM